MKPKSPSAKQKVLIFDSGTLISIVMAGLLPELVKLKKTFGGKFVITSEVKRETIDKPLTIRRFELEAMQIQNLLDERILEMPDSLGIKNSEIAGGTNKFLEIANSTFTTSKKDV